jgi:hypothetical protein
MNGIKNWKKEAHKFHHFWCRCKLQKGRKITSLLYILKSLSLTSQILGFKRIRS